MDTKSPSLNKNCDEFSGGGEEKKKEKKKHTSFNIRRMGRKKDKADRATGLGRARRGREIQKKEKEKESKDSPQIPDTEGRDTSDIPGLSSGQVSPYKINVLIKITK